MEVRETDEAGLLMKQAYQTLVQEDLNVGTGRVWVTAPSSGRLRSTQVGIHSFARGQREWTDTWNPGAIAASSYATTTITVTDAEVADFVMARHDKLLTNDLIIVGHVSADDTVKVVIYNPTTASITVASGTLGVLVFPTNGATPGPAADFTWVVASPALDVDVQFTDTSSGGTAPYTYAWYFGTGLDTSEDQNPLYTYNKGGGTTIQVFTVTLTITDQNGLTSYVEHDVTVIFTGGT